MDSKNNYTFSPNNSTLSIDEQSTSQELAHVEATLYREEFNKLLPLFQSLKIQQIQWEKTEQDHFEEIETYRQQNRSAKTLIEQLQKELFQYRNLYDQRELELAQKTDLVASQQDQLCSLQTELQIQAKTFENDLSAWKQKALSLNQELRLKSNELSQLPQTQNENKALRSELDSVQHELVHLRIENQKLKSEVASLSDRSRRVEDLTRQNANMQLKFESDLRDHTLMNSELRTFNLQKNEEIKALRKQLDEKTKELVKLELRLQDRTGRRD